MFTACSLGIYQAYFPFTASILVIYLLKKTLSEEYAVKELFQKGILYCTSMLGGLCLYLVLLQVSLKWSGKTLTSYQNIDQMGGISLAEIPGMLMKAFTTFFTYPVKYESHYRLALTPVLQAAYFLCIIISIVLVSCMVVRIRKKSVAFSAAFFASCFPLQLI